SDERLIVRIGRHSNEMRPWGRGAGGGAEADFQAFAERDRNDRIAANISAGCLTYGTGPAPPLGTRGAGGNVATPCEQAEGIGSSRPWTPSAGTVTESS